MKEGGEGDRTDPNPDPPSSPPLILRKICKLEIDLIFLPSKSGQDRIPDAMRKRVAKATAPTPTPTHLQASPDTKTDMQVSN